MQVLGLPFHRVTDKSNTLVATYRPDFLSPLDGRNTTPLVVQIIANTIQKSISGYVFKAVHKEMKNKTENKDRKCIKPTQIQIPIAPNELLAKLCTHRSDYSSVHTFVTEAYWRLQCCLSRATCNACHIFIFRFVSRQFFTLGTYRYHMVCAYESILSSPDKARGL